MTRELAPSSPGVWPVVLPYALVASVWILLSEWVMGLLVSDPEGRLWAGMFKGWAFVAVTSVLLYALIDRLVGQLRAAHRRELDHERARQQPPPMLVAIAAASADAIFAKDNEGRYLLFNNAASRFVGQSAESILDHDDIALFPPEQAEQIMSIDRRVRASGETETGEEVLQTADGVRIFLATKGPLRGADGRVFGTYGISRDITARKAAEAELRQRNEELERFNGAATERELRMIALKREVNALAVAAGRPAPYDVAFAETPVAKEVA